MLPSMTPESALSQLLEVETDLSLALGHENNEACLQVILTRFDSIGLVLNQIDPEDMSDVAGWTRVAHAVQRVQTIAAFFAEQEESLLQGISDVKSTVRALLQQQKSHGVTNPLLHEQLVDQEKCSHASDGQIPFASDPSKHNEQTLNAVIMRRWMLEHIEHPFPNAQDKDHIIAETNREVTSAKGQLRPEQVSPDCRTELDNEAPLLTLTPPSQITHMND